MVVAVRADVVYGIEKAPIKDWEAGVTLTPWYYRG
jgi:hypothetical protein